MTTSSTGSRILHTIPPSTALPNPDVLGATPPESSIAEGSSSVSQSSTRVFVYLCIVRSLRFVFILQFHTVYTHSAQSPRKYCSCRNRGRNERETTLAMLTGGHSPTDRRIHARAYTETRRQGIVGVAGPENSPFALHLLARN